MFARTSASAVVDAAVRKPLRLLPLDVVVHIGDEPPSMSPRANAS